MLDVKFFIISLQLIAAIIPLISELLILPKNVRKHFDRQEQDVFKEQFRNSYQIAFFYLLFISLLLELHNYFSPIKIEHFIEDAGVFAILVLTLIFILFRIKQDIATKGMMIQIGIDEFPIISTILLSVIFFSFMNIISNLELFDIAISRVLFVSTILLLLLYYRLLKMARDDESKVLDKNRLSSVDYKKDNYRVQ